MHEDHPPPPSEPLWTCELWQAGVTQDTAQKNPLLGRPAGASAQFQKARAAGLATFHERDRHVHESQARCSRSSSEGWGRATPHWRTLSGGSPSWNTVGHGLRLGERSLGLCVGEDTFSNHREGGHLCGPGPGRARPRLCVAGRGSPFSTAIYQVGGAWRCDRES